MKTLEEKRKAEDREYYEQKKKANVRLCMCIWTGSGFTHFLLPYRNRDKRLSKKLSPSWQRSTSSWQKWAMPRNNVFIVAYNNFFSCSFSQLK